MFAGLPQQLEELEDKHDLHPHLPLPHKTIPQALDVQEDTRTTEMQVRSRQALDEGTPGHTVRNIVL